MIATIPPLMSLRVHVHRFLRELFCHIILSQFTPLNIHEEKTKNLLKTRYNRQTNIEEQRSSNSV
jgi:hypothetical protein